MGYEYHAAMMATVDHFGDTRADWVDFDKWVMEQPEEFRHLCIGPIPAVANGYVSYVVMPSGSRAGYEDNLAHQQVMASFRTLMMSVGADVVLLEYGADMRRQYEEPTIRYANGWVPDQ